MPIVEINEISNSKVFLRVDFDVPIIDNIVQNTYRIKRAIPTIQLLLQNNNTVIMFTKVGRPNGFDEHLSTKHFIPILNQELGTQINFVDDIDKLPKSFMNRLTLFENTRFFEWEEARNEEFDRRMANFFDYYVDEAFAVSHREETSNFGIPSKMQYLALGLNYKKEIEYLEKVRQGLFEKPAIFILGGAKAETKIPMIEKVRGFFNYIIVGGKLVQEEAMKSLKLKVPNVVLLPLETHNFDINTKAIETVNSAVTIAKTIIWNGPLGMFEKEEYATSTKKLISALEAKQNCLTLIGGGDTISAIEKYGDFSKYSFVSTGGGAMFSYLTGEKTNIEKLLANTSQSQIL